MTSLTPDVDTISIECGLGTYIQSIELGRNSPPCFSHLVWAIDLGSDIQVIEYILQEGVSPNSPYKVMDEILGPDHLYGPTCYEYVDPKIILLFEYGAEYDPSTLQFLDEEIREHFLELKNQAFTNIKG